MEDIGITCLSEVRSRDEANGEGREGEKRQKIEEDQVISSSSPKNEGEGEGGGGLLDNLLAKLSSPTSRAAPSHTIDGHDLEAANGDTEGGVNDDVDTAGAGGGAGVINNIISSIFHRGGDEGENGKHGGDQEKIEENKVGDEDLAQQNGGTKVNGGSIISNLIPDDVAPASDEASILIHSVVHD